MSLFDQPGVEKLTDRELPVAVKVTGRNIGAVSLLVSAAAEASGEEAAIGVLFAEDGALRAVTISSRSSGDATARPGEYLLLAEGSDALMIADEAAYLFAKTFLPFLDALDSAFTAEEKAKISAAVAHAAGAHSG